MFRPTKFAASIRASVVSSPTSASSAPITPAMTSPRSSSAITSISSSSRRVEPSRSVICSPWPRPPYDDALPHLRRVEGVYGLAGLQHDVVGSIDDGVDGPHAGGVDATPHPERRLLSGRQVGDAPQVVPRAEIPGLDPQPEVLCRLTSRLQNRFWNPVADLEDGGEFSRDPDHAPQVGPVGGDVDVQHGLPDRKVVRNGTPDLVRLVEQQYPFVVGGDAELALAHHHPVGLQAPQFCFPQFCSVGHDASGQHDGHAGAGVRIGGAGDDLYLVAAEVDLRHEEPVGVGMGTELHDLPHHDLAVGDPEMVDAIYFLAVE